MKLAQLDKMDSCRHLLPEPGVEVVGELIAEVRRLRLVLMDIRDPRPSQQWQADKINNALST